MCRSQHASAVAEFLREHHRVEIDGRVVEGELARVNFLERTLRTSRVIDPPEELDVHSAMSTSGPVQRPSCLVCGTCMTALRPT